VYLQKDIPALHLSGTKKWWPRKTLEKFALQALALPQRQSAQIIERVAGAVSEAANLIPSYIRDNPGFKEVGGLMLSTWQDGLDDFSNPGPRD
jgi:serine/threonine-protein kinase HipA